jgi:DNA-directed RNA polymerase specialized sigma24 family protein
MTEANHEDKHAPFRDHWREKIEEFAGPLLGYATRLVRKVNVGEPWDVVNAAACHTLLYAPDPKTVTKPRSYLFRSVHNIWADAVGKSKVGIMDSLSDPENVRKMEAQLPPVPPEVLAIFQDEPLMKRLERLGTLDDEEKEMLANVIAGYTVEEIAKFRREDVCRTKTRWHALVQKLRYRRRTRE